MNKDQAHSCIAAISLSRPAEELDMCPRRSTSSLSISSVRSFTSLRSSAYISPYCSLNECYIKRRGADFSIPRQNDPSPWTGNVCYRKRLRQRQALRNTVKVNFEFLVQTLDWTNEAKSKSKQFVVVKGQRKGFLSREKQGAALRCSAAKEVWSREVTS